MTSGGRDRDEGVEEDGECRPTSGSHGVCLKTGTDNNFFFCHSRFTMLLYDSHFLS